MKFIRMCNNFMFARRFNYFDVITILIISAVAVVHGYWWFLLYVPATFISVLMERLVKND